MYKSKRSWGGAFIGLLMVLTGIAGSYFIAGHMVVGYVSSADWVEVPATIRRMEFVKNHDRSDNRTTYTLDGAYVYQFDEAQYRNHQFSLSFGSDNVGTYWTDLYHKLAALHHDNAVTALVNPENPSQAVLDRTLRVWHLLFGSLFLLAFAGIGLVAIRSSLNIGGRNTRRSTTSTKSRNPKVINTERYVDIVGGAERILGLFIFCAVAGTFLGSIGMLAIKDGWGPGYLFLMIGCVIFLCPICMVGKKLDIRIDKQTRLLYVRTSWFRLVSYGDKAEVLDSKQFTVKHVATRYKNSRKVDYYTLYFHSDGKSFRISGWIENRRVADSLRRQVVACCIDGDAAMPVAA